MKKIILGVVFAVAGVFASQAQEISFEKEIHDFEHAQFIIDNSEWESSIVLTKENIEDRTEGKLVKFIACDRFRIESFSFTETLN